ncbi:MAG: nitroreductase family protein [Bacteroidales bacterium]
MESTEMYKKYIEVVLKRFSCRAYSPKPVERETLMRIMECARMAPSAVNKQPWKFLIIDTPELLEVLYKSYPRDFIQTAPLCIVAVGAHHQAWHRAHDGKDHTDVDLSIAIEHICLAATSLGLGTCWICNFDPVICREGLSIPEGWEPIAIIPLGYPATDATPMKKRKEMDEIVKWGSFE